jgi:hypothetical protein
MINVKGRSPSMQVQTLIIVRAPAALVRDVYADYTGWAGMFPTISAVRLKERHGSTLILELDHVEGRVINELTGFVVATRRQELGLLRLIGATHAKSAAGPRDHLGTPMDLKYAYRRNVMCAKDH